MVPFTGVWVLDPLPKNPEPAGSQPAQGRGQRLITLTTCSEIFHTDDRMIAFGHLVKADREGPGSLRAHGFDKLDRHSRPSPATSTPAAG